MRFTKKQIAEIARQLYGEETAKAVSEGKTNMTFARHQGMVYDRDTERKAYLNSHKYRTEMRRQFPKFA